MKAWYDEIDSATLQRIKTYSAFNDATSKNLMIQTMYEYREKEIQDFKETNHELAETCIERRKRIAEFEKEKEELISQMKTSYLAGVKVGKDTAEAELEKENVKLKKRCDKYEIILSKMEKGVCDICKETEKDKKIEELEKENAELKEKLAGAKEILREYIRVNLEPPIERSFDDEIKLVKQAEQFLEEIENDRNRNY